MKPILIAALLLTAACGESADVLPGGTFAGSTADDKPFVLEVGEKVKVNRAEIKPVDVGVYALERGNARVTFEFDVTDDKGEELRATITVTPEVGQPVTEVIDLMLL